MNYLTSGENSETAQNKNWWSFSLKYVFVDVSFSNKWPPKQMTWLHWICDVTIIVRNFLWLLCLGTDRQKRHTRNANRPRYFEAVFVAEACLLSTCSCAARKVRFPSSLRGLLPMWLTSRVGRASLSQRIPSDVSCLFSFPLLTIMFLKIQIKMTDLKWSLLCLCDLYLHAFTGALGPVCDANSWHKLTAP